MYPSLVHPRYEGDRAFAGLEGSSVASNDATEGTTDVTNNPAAFNAGTNTGNTFYGWWDAGVLTPTSGGPVSVPRHMGLISDSLLQGTLTT